MPEFRCDPTILGTLYLKRAYQKNMLLGMLMGVLLHFAALGTYYLVTYETAPAMMTGERVRTFDTVTVDLIPPPSITHDEAMRRLHPEEIAIPPNFIPTPAEDWEVAENVVLPTKQEKHILAQGTAEGDGEDFDGVVKFPDLQKEVMPDINEVTLVQYNPEPISLSKPEYPEMARRAGLEASVIVRVLVDVDGKVVEARIMKASTEGIGFEEAALEAALKGEWTAAVQNGRAVPCWVSYVISFELD